MVTKLEHEIRDPIHVFIKVDSDERNLLDTRQVQRLRHIHQLALSYLVYPGATHRRFEHSLGVMELAGRVFDVITENLSGELLAEFPEVRDQRERDYWRRVVRLAGLCHDLGHLPFSHAAEHELLPAGYSHETLSRHLIESDELRTVFDEMTPPVRPEHVVKVAVKTDDLDLTVWEGILNDIITGDAFGVDRMDYLLRDSHHLGVAYGRFDHHRLIDTLRILSSAPTDEAGSREPTLGVEEGGLHSAEALLLARYFMFSQVYFHPVRKIYDKHLQDFMSALLPDGYPTDLEGHLAMTDDAVIVAARAAGADADAPGHGPAQRILDRKHFKRVYSATPAERDADPNPGRAVLEAVTAEFGDGVAHYTEGRDRGGEVEFPVLTRDGEIASSLSMSQVLPTVPAIAYDDVFVRDDLESDVKAWLEPRRTEIVGATADGEDG